MNAKESVREFWDRASCGEELYLKGENEKATYRNQSRIRYELEPYILSFAFFQKYRNKKVLEIGVGLGSDHQMFAEHGAELYGIDLTPRAIQNTTRRFELFDLQSKLSVGDAESLNFADNMFDLVYSWGVIHHSPNTQKAVDEIYRVLKPNGDARIMIYNKHSLVGYMLWLRYGLLRLRPFTSLNEIYSRYLESPGTKAYTTKEARKMFSKFSSVKVQIVLSHGDLLSEHAGQRHQGSALSLARKLWPRKIIKSMFPSAGLFMMIAAEK